MQGFDTCGLWQFPAQDILSRLTLLTLRDNDLASLCKALPADNVRNLRVLDVSGNPLGQPPGCAMTAANLAAFAGDWAALRVVGIRPRALQDAPSRLWDSVEALTVLLMRQAAAAQPPRAPPVVVYSGLHERLLLEADELGVIA